MNKWHSVKKRNRFCNPDSSHEPESLLLGTIPSLAKAFFSRFWRKVPSSASWLSPQQIPFRTKELSITWIGHASFLIQIDGINIITDPVFGEVSSFFPRILAPGIHIEAVPTIDYVLISHNHWDHMDASSLKALKKRNPNMHVLVPQGDKDWFLKRTFSVSEHDWWDTIEKEKCSFNFLPAVHWSGRGVFDKNRSLWGSWMINAGSKKIYFAGDTAYGEHFTQIAQECGPSYIALLPIGPCEPKEWMSRTHMNPDRSLQAFIDLQATHFIPMHWGTFPFGNDQFDEPVRYLDKIKQRARGTVHLIKAGTRTVF